VYPWITTTVPVYVPRHDATRHCAVTARMLNGGPQDEKLDGLVFRDTWPAPRPMTLARRVTSVTDGAHLNESSALPELPLPAPPENLMVSGFIVQIDLGSERDAKLTAAYAATIVRLIERPTSR
jgi:hypothetical protein